MARGKRTDIETKGINEIKLNPNNPRIIKDDKFHKLVESVKSFPEMLELRPIVVNKDMIILGGNIRFKACKEAWYKEIPVIVADNLTEEQEREFLIKDNVSGGEWDWDILANEWDKEELEEWWLDVQFETVEPTAEEDDFEVDEGIKTDIVIWDLFEIWPHRLLCWDSTNIDDVNKLMNGEKADMVFTDPPYWANMGIMNDWEEFDKIFQDTFSILPCDDNIYICSDWRCVGHFMNTIRENWFEVYNLIVWVKNLFWQWKLYHTKHEEIIFCWKWNYLKDKLNDDVNVWDADSVRNFWGSKNAKEAVWHPTQKPVEICTRAINNSSRVWYKVYDCFWWSGSTMVACHQLNRRCYMSELDPKYVQTIVNRMQKLDPSLVIKRNWKPYLIGK